MADTQYISDLPTIDYSDIDFDQNLILDNGSVTGQCNIDDMAQYLSNNSYFEDKFALKEDVEDFSGDTITANTIVADNELRCNYITSIDSDDIIFRRGIYLDGQNQYIAANNYSIDEDGTAWFKNLNVQNTFFMKFYTGSKSYRLTLDSSNSSFGLFIITRVNSEDSSLSFCGCFLIIKNPNRYYTSQLTTMPITPITLEIEDKVSYSSISSDSTLHIMATSNIIFTAV